jgi:hypothetical protein
MEGFLWNLWKAFLLGVVQIEGISKRISSQKEGIRRIPHGILLGGFQIQETAKRMHNLAGDMWFYEWVVAQSCCQALIGLVGKASRQVSPQVSDACRRRSQGLRLIVLSMVDATINYFIA